MQQVSFPDINSSPTVQAIAPPLKQEPIPGIPEVPGAMDPKTGIGTDPSAPDPWMKSSDGTAKNQMGKDEVRSRWSARKRWTRKSLRT